MTPISGMLRIIYHTAQPISSHMITSLGLYKGISDIEKVGLFDMVTTKVSI